MSCESCTPCPESSPVAFNLKGDPGEPGSKIYTGSTTPSNTLGANSDIYVNISSGAFYQKEAGIWVIKGSLIGPPGTNGTNGAAGTDGVDGNQIYVDDGVPSGGLGQDGDVYIGALSGDLYKKVAGVWALEGNLQGPPGAGGTAGQLSYELEVLNLITVKSQPNIHYLSLNAIACSVDSLTVKTDGTGGTATVFLKKNGTYVGNGLSTLASGNAKATYTPSSAVTYAAGDTIDLEINMNAAADLTAVTLRVTPT